MASWEEKRYLDDVEHSTLLKQEKLGIRDPLQKLDIYFPGHRPQFRSL